MMALVYEYPLYFAIICPIGAIFCACLLADGLPHLPKLIEEIGTAVASAITKIKKSLNDDGAD